jgi:pimeloyl-ACP methyl ester carboxylesterase
MRRINPWPAWLAWPAVLAATTVLFPSCVKFVKLESDIDFMAGSYIISGAVEDAERYPRLYGLVVEWDQAKNEVLSVDRARVGSLGVFAFFVKRAGHQYALAYSDTNANDAYDTGEPAWITADAHGAFVPVVVNGVTRRGTATLTPAAANAPLPALAAAALAFRGKRTTAETVTGWSIPIALGDLADLDDPRFSAVRGEKGLWEPASFPRETGMGIYFLEPYDPHRIPVLFVYGAAGSPQDWRTFFSALDRTKYQAWFYLYPSGRRLGELGDSLASGVELLHARLGFTRLDVVAHSMGGLVSRQFLARNVLDDGNGYVRRFVSISTPWGGHEAASMGVKFGPAVVPSWRDMVTGSDFQKAVLSRPLKGKVDHLLIYGHHASRSLVLPDENDGTVSVASELQPAAKADAVRVVGFDADHVGILSRPEVVQLVQEFLGAPLP